MSWKLFFSFVFTLALISLLATYWLLPFGTTQFYKTQNSGNFNFTLDNSDDLKMQFYDNMRYPNKEILYNIESCSIQKRYEMEQALEIVSNLTILKFNPSDFGWEISVTCDEKTRIENGLFIGGEGGPVNITNTTNFNVIFNGEVLLIRESKCPKPNIAIHELLHALGFSHSLNPESIMYNITNCEQQIGDDIINKINTLYSVPSYPDLSIEDASAILRGKYLDANITVRNQGLLKSERTNILIKADNNTIDKIELPEMGIGQGNEIFLSNVFVPKLSVNELEFSIIYTGDELEKNNNKINLKIKK
ncbi:hypothetical protein COU59_00900 [Candidatus Pacearchaeota archaeon CG10_big_fil_rev_8_21_14_0_10_34_12]|nr:MAG: hypothetical protein COU59_00900 [Candidatus Pacearchaeota archaeon CG10_big_fil_rev_8_21_14_0_10_34_12]